MEEPRHRHPRQNPSFSSSLLNAIYRSIDESNRPETMRKKQSLCNLNDDESDMLNFHLACMIEKSMEKKVTEMIVVRRTSMVDLDRKARNVCDCDFNKLMNSSSSSLESSSGGWFSSSESKSMQRPKPIRLGHSHRNIQCNPKHDRRRAKSSIRAAN